MPPGPVDPSHSRSDSLGCRALRIGMLGSAGVAYLAASLFNFASDGGLDAALFFGTFGFVITFPILLLLGRLTGALFGRFRDLGERGRLVMVVAPTLMVTGLATYEGCHGRDPLRKFERWVASPAPPGTHVLTAYTCKGINYWDWAFHFTIAPDDLPSIRARRSYRHEIDLAGFDLDRVREKRKWRPGYPVPPPGFKAVHLYRYHAPTERLGYDVTLYADTTQTEFFAYGYVE